VRNGSRCCNDSSCEISFAVNTRPLRDTSSAVNPAANAPQTADNKFSRHATLPTGKRCVHSHPTNVQTGYPGGCGTPKLHAAVTSSPESSSVTLGASVTR